MLVLHRFLDRLLFKLMNIQGEPAMLTSVVSSPDILPRRGRRGDLLLGRILYSESLEFEANGELLDRSYAHRTDEEGNNYPFRPAVVRSVTHSGDNIHLTLYPITRRTDKLSGIAAERSHTFQSLPCSRSSMDTPDTYVYTTNLHSTKSHAEVRIILSHSSETNR